MGKAALLPHRRSSPWLARVAGVVALVCLASLLRPRAGAGPRQRPDPPAGRFPQRGDPFRLVPCTNETLPPALDDLDPARWSRGSATGVFLCGFLDVPLDYTNASDRRIARLAVTRFQAAGAAARSARTLVVEPGGPGGSGTAMVWRSAETLSRRLGDSRLDVLGWDPRGVNASLPAAACFPFDADRDRWGLRARQHRREATDARAQLAFVDAFNDAVLGDCRRRLGDLARFVSTAFVAQLRHRHRPDVRRHVPRQRGAHHPRRH